MDGERWTEAGHNSSPCPPPSLTAHVMARPCLSVCSNLCFAQYREHRAFIGGSCSSGYFSEEIEKSNLKDIILTRGLQCIKVLKKNKEQPMNIK